MKMILRKCLALPCLALPCLALAMIVLVGCDSNYAPEDMDSRIYEIGIQVLEVTDRFLNGDISINTAYDKFFEHEFLRNINNILLEGGNRREDHSVVDLNVSDSVHNLTRELGNVWLFKFADWSIDALDGELSVLDNLLEKRNELAEILGEEKIHNL